MPRGLGGRYLWRPGTGCRPEDHPAIIQGARGVKIAVSWDRAVAVIPANSGKGVAIEKILAYDGLDASQALAFGDSQNDLEMLQVVGPVWRWATRQHS